MIMLHTVGLPNGFWEFAVSMAVHLYNHTPSYTHKWKMPVETWNPGNFPDVSYFLVFGCKGPILTTYPPVDLPLSGLPPWSASE